MTNLFLEQYSLSGCLTFDGFFKHKEALSQEKDWNSYAVAHLLLATLQLVPGVSQICYILEGITFSLFFESAKTIKPTQVNLEKGTLFGTKNQYTGAEIENVRQSCTVQALTFLKNALSNPRIHTPMIDRCLEEGHQIFQRLSEEALEKRQAAVRDHLSLKNVPQKEIGQFFRENPGIPKMWPLNQFLTRYPDVSKEFVEQNLSGNGLTAKEAFEDFKAGLKLISDTTKPLERQGSFQGIFPEVGCGTVITCNGCTLAIATLADAFLIYDSHGNTAKHEGNSAAFVKVMKTREEAEAFLATIFDYREDGTNQVEMMTTSIP